MKWRVRREKGYFALESRKTSLCEDDICQKRWEGANHAKIWEERAPGRRSKQSKWKHMEMRVSLVAAGRLRQLRGWDTADGSAW